jgi:hypothetical protein
MGLPALLADLVVAFHFLYLLFTVGGEALILAGAVLHWRWIRNPVFRRLHLVAVVIVAVEALIGYLCPLTQIEYNLRQAAGQQVETEISFVGRLIRSVLFYDFPGWFFTLLYVGFGILVIATYMLISPRTRKKQEKNSAPYTKSKRF